MEKQNQQTNKNQSLSYDLNNEALRVEFATNAGGEVVHDLVKQGEKMLQNNSSPSTKWWILFHHFYLGGC